MRRGKRIGMVTQVVLAELAGVIAEVVQELGERGRAGPQIRWAARQLRRDHAGAQWGHAGEESVAPGRAALLGVVAHKLGALVANAVNVGRFAESETSLVADDLHPADVIAHDEEDVRLLLRRSRCRHLLLRDRRSSRYNRCHADGEERRQGGRRAGPIFV